MADDRALKPKSFRIDDETAEKFKAIATTIGGNQQETLAKLIEAFEFQSSKAVLVDKKADIEQFERYTATITRMFMGCLEDNQNITESVRTEFDALLRSKDSTIQDLQGQLNLAKQLKDEAESKAKSHADESTRLNKMIDGLNAEINNLRSMLDDKDSLNKALTDSCNELKAKVEDMTESAGQSATLQGELNQLKKDYEHAIKEQSKNMDAIKDLKQHEADALELQKEQLQLEFDKALLQVEKSYQAEIQQLKADRQADIDKYQQRYFDLLEQINPESKTTSKIAKSSKA